LKEKTSIIMRQVIWYSPPGITSSEAIAVAMVAGIVLMIISTCLNPSKVGLPKPLRRRGLQTSKNDVTFLK
jgi:hypothetical protein